MIRSVYDLGVEYEKALKEELHKIHKETVIRLGYETKFVEDKNINKYLCDGWVYINKLPGDLTLMRKYYDTN